MHKEWGVTASTGDCAQRVQLWW